MISDAVYESMVADRDRIARDLELAEDENDRLAGALRALVERVEMDESVGICLSDRVPSLNALAILTEKG